MPIFDGDDKAGSRVLFTIGYEKAGFGAFVETLRQAGVRRVIDIRDLPLSRRAGFSKRQLAAGLDEAGIGYLHLKALGTPAAGREANRRRQWPLFWQIVEESLARSEAQAALVEAGEAAAGSASALLCYEAEACICHRRRVGELLSARHGFRIEDLRVTAPFEPL
ncbi:DUF488 domain-containing protein [Acidisoma sp. 7E03]